MLHGDLIHKRVSLVVMGIDDFTNRIIQDSSLQIWSPGQARPVRKTAGYYIFLDCPQELVTIKLTAPFFYGKELVADLREGQKLPLILRVRLYPNGRYPFPRGVFLLEGKAPAGSEIQVLGGSLPSVKLMADYQKKTCGKVLQLYQADGFCLDGKLFEISLKDSSAGEQFRVEQQADGEMFQYYLERPLKKDYKKGLTVIRPIAETQADEQGRYLLPIYCREGDTVLCQCLSGKKLQKQECQVSGNRILLDFDM